MVSIRVGDSGSWGWQTATNPNPNPRVFATAGNPQLIMIIIIIITVFLELLQVRLTPLEPLISFLAAFLQVKSTLAVSQPRVLKQSRGSSVV